jgi:hypothetical protein
MPHDSPEWISRREARRILAIGYTALAGLAASGRVTVREVPGARSKFLRSEIEQLAAGSTRLASRRAEEARP